MKVHEKFQLKQPERGKGRDETTAFPGVRLRIGLIARAADRIRGMVAGQDLNLRLSRYEIGPREGIRPSGPNLGKTRQVV